ncbi:hypothetical protein ACLWP4_001221 [Campylobacter jejuni]
MFDEEEDLPDFESEEAYQEWERKQYEEWEKQEQAKYEKRLEIEKELFGEFLQDRF